jgi:DNA-binding transcriptional LysR family regulator
MFKLRSLDLNLLTVFEAIYETGTVGGAADHLALSQSATSDALSRLREACNDDLFVRNRHGLSPTQVAKAMYPPSTKRGRFCVQVSRKPAVSIPSDRNASSASASRTPWGLSMYLSYERQPRLSLRDWPPVAFDPFVNGKLFEDRLVIVARSDHPSVGHDLTIKELSNWSS